MSSTRQLSVGWDYAVVIDAGSTGSRVHVYRYYTHRGSSWPTVELPDAVHKTTPGLSAYAFEPKTAATSLEPLLRFAKQQVPADRVSNTPIQLLATAGLRALPNDTAQRLLVAARGALSSSGFKFRPEWARVLPGREEGLWGWLAVNYARGAFGQGVEPVVTPTEAAALGRKGGPSDTHSNSSSSSSSSSKPPGFLGVLELGGASMQVTFLPQPFAKVPPQDVYSIPDLTPWPPAQQQQQKQQGKQQQVAYTHSFDGVGLQASLNKWSSSLGSGAPDPCLPKGFTSSEGVKGSGDWRRCREGLVALLPRPPNGRCSQATWGNCSLGDVVTPPLSGTLLGLDNLFYTGEALGLPSGPAAPPTSLAALEGAGMAWCATPWGQLTHSHKQRIPSFFLPKVCFAAAWVSALLREGLHLAPDAKLLALSNSVLTPKGTPVSVNWALGAVLVEVLAQQQQHQQQPAATAGAAAAVASAATSSSSSSSIKAGSGSSSSSKAGSGGHQYVAAAPSRMQSLASGGFSEGMAGTIAFLFCIALILLSLLASAARVGVAGAQGRPSGASAPAAAGGAGNGLLALVATGGGGGGPGRSGYTKVRTTQDDAEEGGAGDSGVAWGGPRGGGQQARVAPQVLVSTGRRQQGMAGGG